MKKFFKSQGLLIFSIIAVIIVCIFYCSEKKGMFLDEIYSYGLSNSQETPFITNIKGNIVNTTITKQELYNYVTVNSNDAFDYVSVYNNQSRDVHPPLFYFLFHTVSSIFQNSYSKWIGLGLNLTLFLLSIFIFYLLIKKLFKSKSIALCGIILYGLNTLAISAMLMIRMYMLLTLLTLLLPYTLVCLNTNKKWYNYLFVSLTILAGLLTQYYYVFYAFFVCASNCIYLLQKKAYKNLLLFSISAILGAACVVPIFPSCIKQLLGTSAVAGASVIGNLTNFSEYPLRLKAFLGFAIKYNKIAIFVGLLSLFLCILNFKVLIEKIQNKKINLYPLAFIIPTFITFFIVAIIAPYITARYIYNLTPIFILTVCFVMNLGKYHFIKKTINTKIFTIILLIIATIASLQTKPEYLYEHYENQENQISQYQNEPCIYITENKNPAITQDLIQLLNFEKIHITLSTDTKELNSYINSFDTFENIVVHIAYYPEPLDDKKLLNELCKKYDFKSYETLYKRGFSTIYILTN